MNIRSQNLRSKTWIDEQGLEIPTSRLTAVEKLREKYAFALASDAAKVHGQIVAFKTKIAGMCKEVFEQVMTAKEKQKATKGNFTWYNFDGSIKIEVSIDDRIDFDSLLLEKCKQKLLELIGETISTEHNFLKELVLGAFQTSRGKLDTKKILSLKKYSNRITDRRYTEAMKLLDESIRRPSSKTYFRVWVKDEAGKYENIDLNFSSIS